MRLMQIIIKNIGRLDFFSALPPPLFVLKIALFINGVLYAFNHEYLNFEMNVAQKITLFL